MRFTKSNIEKFFNPKASEEHRSTVKAICTDLDPDSDLYKCLLNTTNTKEIDECFQQYSNKTGNSIITSSVQEASTKAENKAKNSVCLPTQMKHNGKEYIIDTHPDIKRWGVENPICKGMFVPDHEAQKHGVSQEKVRCKTMKDVVPRKKYDELSMKYKDCKKVFNNTKCDNNMDQTTLSQAPLSEAFQNQIQLPSLGESSNIEVGTKPFGNYSITNHKQFKEIIKDYTPNNELPQVCSAYIEENLDKYPIEAHPDIAKYTLKSSIPAPKRCRKLEDYPIVAHPDINDYVHKDSIQKWEDYDIKKHPEIGNYVLKSTLPVPKRCKGLNEQDITKHKDMKDYVLKDNVKPCEVPNPRDIKKHPQYKNLLNEYNIQIDKCGKPTSCDINNSSEFNEMTSNLEHTKNQLKKQQNQYANLLRHSKNLQDELGDGCATNFVNQDTGKTYNYEGMTNYAEYFTNPKTHQKEGYQNSEETSERVLENKDEMLSETASLEVASTEIQNKPRDSWDIKNHKDFDDYISKEECYGKYASKDKCGKIVKCNNKGLKDYDISEHPDYEKVLLKFGALKSKCGKLIPAPKCPCIVKDKCGKYKYKACLPQKKCPVCKETKKDKCEMKDIQADLVKSKIKIDILIQKYKDLFETHKNTQSSLIEAQRKGIQNEIKNKNEIEGKRNDLLKKMEKEQNNKIEEIDNELKGELNRLKTELENGKVAKNTEKTENVKQTLESSQSKKKDLSSETGWVYKKPTTTATNDGRHKFYHPTKTNYRMLEDK
jgi:hypothetical protein